MRRFLFLLLLCVLIPVEASDEEIPFMYYYDESESAFIVERADGSDRRILAEYAFPDMVNSNFLVIGGAGWSPSGEWFVLD